MTYEGRRATATSESIMSEYNLDKLDSKESPTGSLFADVFRLLISLLAGTCFGICIEKSRVFEPVNLRNQFEFTNFIMMKMLLSTILAGQVLFTILSLIPKTTLAFKASVDLFTTMFIGKGVLTSLLGPFVLGIGMSISGSCPVIVSVQVGTWTPYAVVTLCGGLVGALAYGLIAHRLSFLKFPKKEFENFTIHQKLKVPYASISIPMSVILAVVIMLLELYFPWKSELSVPNVPLPISNAITMRAWSPIVAGSIIGFMQIVVVFGDGDSLGSSSAYVTVMAQWLITKKVQQMFPYLTKYKGGLANWWQVLYFVGAISGGAMSALSSDTFMTSLGRSPVASFGGGFLMLFGARFGTGCTSIHGLSGIAILVWLSLIAVPMMYAGAFITSFVFKETGILQEFTTW